MNKLGEKMGKFLEEKSILFITFSFKQQLKENEIEIVTVAQKQLVKVKGCLILFTRQKISGLFQELWY